MAANTQIGKTNSQTVGTTNNIAPTVSLKPNARVDTIDQSNTTINKVDPLLLLIAILGWLAPSPAEIARSIRGLFRRKS